MAIKTDPNATKEVASVCHVFIDESPSSRVLFRPSPVLTYPVPAFLFIWCYRGRWRNPATSCSTRKCLCIDALVKFSEPRHTLCIELFSPSTRHVRRDWLRT